MSVTYVPEGYVAGDMLAMPVYLSDSSARVSPPDGWQVALLPSGDPLELEHAIGFFTAFWKQASDEEPEVVLDPGDPTVHVAAQIMAFHNDSGEEWRQPPVGVFAAGAATAVGEGFVWRALTEDVLPLHGGDAVMTTTVLNDEQAFSGDVLNAFFDHLSFGEGTFGSHAFGGVDIAGTIISSPAEIESAYTGTVQFRTAFATVTSGTSAALLEHTATAEDADSGLLLLLRLGDSAAEERTPFEELSTLTFAQKSDLDIIGFSDGEHMSFEDIDVFAFEETAIPFLSEFTVKFNDSLNAPGFRIKLRGLLDFDTIEVYRRDPLGRYPDQAVRGLANVDVISDTADVIDYEAPLNTILHYYIRLTKADSSTFHFGPVYPQPDRYIPTLYKAYGGGTAYLKPIDAPELGRPVYMDPESLRTWETEANVLASHRVLGRPNKITITDIMGGREGTIKGHIISHKGQSLAEIESLFAGGHTMLIQNHNPTYSAFHDMYVKIIGSVSYQRRTKMVHIGELSNPPTPQVIVTFTASYEQQDRPDPQGEVIADNTWQDIWDYYKTWENVFANNRSWLDVLKKSVKGLPSPWEESP